MSKKVSRGVDLKGKIKGTLLSLFTFLLCFGLYQVWYLSSTQAAIGTVQNWGAVAYNGTNSPGNLTYAVNASATNRLLVVAVSSVLAANSTTQTCAVTYGGLSLNEAVSDKTSAARQHTWLFYLKDTPSVMTGTNQTLSVTVTNGGQTFRNNQVYVAVYSGVDQDNPVADTKTYNSLGGTTATPTFPSALIENIGNQPVTILTSVRTGNTNPRNISANTTASWAISQQATFSNVEGIRTAVLTRTIPGSNTSDVAPATISAATLASMCGMSIKAAPTDSTLAVSNNYPIASGTKLDTDQSVMMQRLQLDAPGDVELNSITMDDAGTATVIADAEIYISSLPPQVNMPADAVLIGRQTSWSGTSTQIPLDLGTALNRTVGPSAATTRYLYIVYNMSEGQATKTVQSHVTAVGVASPDTGATSLNFSSNVVTLAFSGNTLTVTGNVPVATEAKDSDVGVVMQHFQVDCDPGFDNAVELNAVTLEDTGTSPEVSGVKIYIDTVEQATLPATAKLVGALSEWNKASTVIPLNDDYGATALDRTVLAGTPKFIYVVYDMYYADVFSSINVQSKVTGVGVASPDAGETGLALNSNLITLTRGTWSKITTCGGCHDTANIQDGTARNEPPGKFIGSHYKHTNYLGKDCTLCHQKPASTHFGHANNFVNLTGVVGSNYSKGLSFQVSNNPVMGTCSNISCHSNGLVSNPTYSTPQWGNSASGGCGSCHGADGASPPASTAHAEHSGSSDGQNSIACVRCHSAVVSATADSTTKPTIIDRPLHGNSAFNIAFDTFNAGVTYTDSSSCANTYCHSSGTTTVSPYGTPKVTGFTWSSSLTCAGCHDTKTTGAVASTLSARHDRHMNPTSNPMIGAGNGFNCVDCHRATITNTDNQTIAAGTRHVDKFVNYTGLRAGGGNRYDTGTKLCTNIYCHSNGNPGAIVPANPTAWNVPTTYGCNGCHGTGNALGYPNYGNGGASTATANLHAGHLAGAANTTACADCHRATGDAGTANKFRNYSTLHLNGSPDVVFNKAKASIGPNATVANVGDTVTCSSVICHGSGSPVWGTSNASVNTCQKCHGSLTVPFSTFSSAQVAPGGSDGTGRDTAGNTAATAARVGAHQIHLAGQVISGRIRCSECHVNVTSVNQASHLNYTTATVRFSGRATAGGHNSTAAVRGADGIVTCNNLYCHTTNYNSGTAMAPKWNNTSYISNSLTASDCTRCHAMPPAAITQHNGVAVVNAFPISDGRCSGCHTNLNNNGTSFADIFTNKAEHVNGITEAAGGHAFPYAGSDHMVAAGTTPWSSCVSVSCHTNGSNTTYPVGAGVKPDCQACHINTLRAPSGTSSCWDCHGASATDGSPNGVAFPNWSGSHRAHVVGKSMACSACHSGGGTGTATHGHSNRVAKTRANVVVSGSFNYASGAMTCSNTYCHSTGQSATGGATPVYATPTWSAVINCGSCHLNMDSSASATGDHVKHAQTNAISCSTCHNGYTETSVTTATHVNNTIELSFSGANATGTVYSQGSGPVGNNYGYCNNSYCHSSGQSTTGGATPVYATPTWGLTVTNCGSCHMNMDTNGSATGDHVKHAQTNGLSCATCHNGYSESTVASATHINKTIELSFSGTNATGTVYSQGNGAVGNNFGYCNNSYCHSSGQSTTGGATPVYATPTWGLTVTNCGSCHLNMDSNGSATGDHAKHAQGSANFACATCHNGYTESTVAASHLDKTVNLSFSGTYGTGTTYSQGSSAVGDGFGNCSASKCHGQGAPVWGGALYSATQQCENCHGSAATSPFYSTAATGATPVKVTSATDTKVGAHTIHLNSATTGLSANIACSECHGTVSALTTPASHMDGSTTFSWGTLARTGGSLTPSIASGTCANNYCHGAAMPMGDTTGTDETPLWTDTAYVSATLDNATCGRCHGFPPAAGSGHPAATAPSGFPTANCNCHANMSTSASTLATIFVDKTKHINGIYEPAASECISCHDAMVAADFVRPSRHVSNGTTTSIVTNFDCIVCHAEGDPTSSGTAIGTTSLHTGSAAGVVDLRNVDNSVTTSAVGNAGTNYWTWNGRRANPLPKGASYTAQRDNMDTFCLNCHDDNGSSTIAVNNSNNGLLLGTANVNVVRTATGTGNSNTNSASAAQRPFNTNDQLKNVNDSGTGGNGAVLGTWRLTTYGRVLNVKSQFNSGGVSGTNWASHHNLNQYTKRYTSNNTTAGTGLPTTVWTSYVTKEGKTMNGTGAGTGANAGLHCSDCHLNEVNAHGSASSWYMLNGPNITTDEDVAPTLSGTAATGASITCFRCHADTQYAVGGGGVDGRVDHSDRCNNIDTVTGTAVQAPFGNTCHACHGGYGDTAQAVNQDTRGTGSTKIGRGPLGAIHGNNETYTAGEGSATKRYRFMSGASMRWWNPAGTATTNWEASTAGSTGNCYTLSGADQWGSCTKHSGTSGAGQTINKARKLTY